MTTFEPSQVVSNGSAVALTATKKSSGRNGTRYEGGWITTEGAFSLSQGLIDFRAEVPAGQGLWSGLWLLNSSGVEIDAAELLLGDTHEVYGSLHDSSTWSETQSTALAADASQGFHDYQVIWQPGMITWAVDGAAYAQYTEAEAVAAGHAWPFDSPSGLYLIADLAVGASSEWGGAPNASTVFPATMQVQSIRVWQ